MSRAPWIRPDKIEAMRKDAEDGMTQTEIAAKHGVHKRTVSTKIGNRRKSKDEASAQPA